jgi:hypothetical protein
MANIMQTMVFLIVMIVRWANFRHLSVHLNAHFALLVNLMALLDKLLVLLVLPVGTPAYPGKLLVIFALQVNIR